ncbi:hypothetical protein MY3296_007478 [Beauveria thailandica]
MRSLAANLRQCTCSALFRTEIDFKRHLSDHAEQRRIRERMIGDLQAEALKQEAHAEVDDESSSESGIDQDSESDGESEDTECHEVCVFCHVSFKRVRKFKRHAEKCVGDSERKRAYMDETCKELTILSDIKLEKALRENRKRSRDESQQAANSVESARRNPRARKRQRIRQQHADNASYAAPTGMDPYSVRSSGAPAAPANVHSQNQTQSLFTEATEAVVPSLGVLENFDAPLMQIMNSAPLDIWPMNACDEEPSWQ